MTWTLFSSVFYQLCKVQDTHQGLQDASVKLLLQLLGQWRIALQLQGKMRGGVEVSRSVRELLSPLTPVNIHNFIICSYRFF